MWKYPLVLTIDPTVADFACENLAGKVLKFRILRSGPHVLEIVKTAIFRDKLRMERLKQDTTGNLWSDQITQPCSSASRSSGDYNGFAQIRFSIDVEATANLLNGPPV
jgi:hypothetical protein